MEDSQLPGRSDLKHGAIFPVHSTKCSCAVKIAITPLHQARSRIFGIRRELVQYLQRENSPPGLALGNANDRHPQDKADDLILPRSKPNCQTPISTRW